LLVASTVLTLAGVLPLLDGYLNRPAAPTRSDFVLRSQNVEGAAAATVLAPRGWQPVDQTRGSITLRSGSSTVDVRMVPAASDAECEQARDSAIAAVSAAHQVTAAGTDERSLATEDGSVGLLTGFSSGLEDGVVFAVCAPGAALVGVAAAPIGARQNSLADVDELVRSIRFR
jgi:hypothetical protein